MERTPGPWTHQPNIGILAGGREIARALVADAYEMSDYDEARANARFIVLACNAHEELVAACRAALDNMVVWSENSAWDKHDEAVYTQLEQALSLAEVTP